MSEQTSPQSVAADVNQRLEALRQFNVSVRRSLEAAELLIPELKVTINRLPTLQTIETLLITAGVVWHQPYQPGQGPSGSAQVYLAALKIPGGIGALVLDAEELSEIERENPSDPVFPATRFSPFEECPPCVKASLLPRIPELLRQLFRHFGIGES